MNRKDWDSLHVGATIHLQKGNFYIRTVGFEPTEREVPRYKEKVESVWDRQGKRLTWNSPVLDYLKEHGGGLLSSWTPCPEACPVAPHKDYDGQYSIVLPGNPLWPELTRHWFKAERGEHTYTQEELGYG